MSDADLFPEHEKLHAIKHQSQTLGEFLEWLSSRGIILAVYEPGRVWPRPYNYRIENLLADFFEIDLDKIEHEKVAMLWSIRNGLQL